MRLDPLHDGVLEEAAAGFQTRGDLIGAADALGDLIVPLSRLADPRTWTIARETLALLEPLGPSAGLVRAVTAVAVDAVFRGQNEEAIRLADQALAIAETLGLPRLARPLGFRGLAPADALVARIAGYAYRACSIQASERVPRVHETPRHR